MKKLATQFIAIIFVWTVSTIGLAAHNLNNPTNKTKPIQIEVPANGVWKKRFVKPKGVKALSISLSSTKIGKLKTEITDLNGKRVSRGSKQVNVWGPYDKRVTYIFVVHSKSSKDEKVTVTGRNIVWVNEKN